MAIADWSTTAANNGTTLGVNIAEGCPPSNVNNAMRQMMADVATGINFSVLGSALASTSLAQFRTAIGVSGGSTSNNNFAALTNTANSVPYMTGSDAWALTTLTSFARTLLDDGDAATARTTLGAIGGASASASSQTGTVSIPLTSSFTLLIQWGVGTLAGNTSSTVNFGTSYSVAPFAMVNGGSTNISNEGDVHNAGGATTSGISIANSAPSSDGYTWIAVGQA